MPTSPSTRRPKSSCWTPWSSAEPRWRDAELGLAYMRLDGLEAMRGGEAQLITSLLNAAPSHLMPRIGVSTGKFPAYLASTRCVPGGAMKVPEGVREFLAPSSRGLSAGGLGGEEPPSGIRTFTVLAR